MKYIFCLFFLFIGNIVFAQENVGTVAEAKKIDSNKEIATLEQQITNSHIMSKESMEAVKNLGAIQDALRKEKETQQQELEKIQKKIDALGPLPAEGVKETANVAKQRKLYSKEFEDKKGEVALIDLNLNKIDEINTSVLQRRSEKLKERILVKQEPIWHIGKLTDALIGFLLFLKELSLTPIEWIKNLPEAEKNILWKNLKEGILYGVIAIIIGFFLSIFIRKKFGYKTEIEKPTYSQKIIAAFCTLLAKGIIPAIVLGLCAYWLFKNTQIFDSNFGIVLRLLLTYTFYLIISLSAVKVLFVTSHQNWHLFYIKEEKSKKLSFALQTTLLLIFICSFFQILGIKLKASDTTIYALKIISNAVKAFSIIWLSYAFLYTNTKLTEEELSKSDEELQGLNFSSRISLLISFSALVVLGASLIGYIRLAEFIYNRFIFSVVLLGLYYIARKFILFIFHRFITMKMFKQRFRISNNTTAILEIWFNILLTLFTIPFLILFFLGVWGVSVDILLQKSKNLLVGFNVGGIHISITSLLLGVLVFFLIISLVRLLKNSLVSGSLSKLNMDTGIRSSIVSGMGFFGFIIAALVAIAVMGGSLKGLAIIAGALSFGAGLGLQNIVNNFVSGFTLLIERPIKIGDWIKVNGQEGIVKQINMRSTQIETFNKTNVIIPNSIILSTDVENLTFKTKTYRLDIPVRVARNVDIELVKTTLYEIASEAKYQSKTLEPFVSFMEVDYTAFVFRLSCYLTDVNHKLEVQTFILSEIVARFKALGIEIPFPQQDIRLVRSNPAVKNPTTKDK